LACEKIEKGKHPDNLPEWVRSLHPPKTVRMDGYVQVMLTLRSHMTKVRVLVAEDNQAMRKIIETTKVIFLSAHADPDTFEAAFETGSPGICA
jgi:hypothetical protein